MDRCPKGNCGELVKMTVHCVTKLQSKNVSSILIQYLQFNRSQKKHEICVIVSFFIVVHDHFAFKHKVLWNFLYPKIDQNSTMKDFLNFCMLNNNPKFDSHDIC